MKKIMIISAMTVALAAGAVAEEQVQRTAEDIYMKMCKKCHGENGEGSAKATEKLCKGYTVEQLSFAAIKGKTDEEVLAILADGLGKMPGYRDRLTDEELDEVLAYCRKLAGE